MTHRQNGLLAFSWRDNALSLYQQFIQIERLFLRVAGKTYVITTSPRDFRLSQFKRAAEVDGHRTAAITHTKVAGLNLDLIQHNILGRAA